MDTIYPPHVPEKEKEKEKPYQQTAFTDLVLFLTANDTITA